MYALTTLLVCVRSLENCKRTSMLVWRRSALFCFVFVWFCKVLAGRSSLTNPCRRQPAGTRTMPRLTAKVLLQPPCCTSKPRRLPTVDGDQQMSYCLQTSQAICRCLGEMKKRKLNPMPYVNGKRCRRSVPEMESLLKEK